MRLSTHLLSSIALVTLLPAAFVTSLLPVIGDTPGGATLAQSVETKSQAQSTGVQSSVTTITPASSPANKHTAPDSGKKAKLAVTKKSKNKGDDFSGDRDCNMFQVEPSVINERYYTSGKAEHHQKMSPTLPFGAEVPDNEGPYTPEKKPAVTGASPKSDSQTNKPSQPQVTPSGT